jgi:hypothetical protein
MNTVKNIRRVEVDAVDHDGREPMTKEWDHVAATREHVAVQAHPPDRHPYWSGLIEPDEPLWSIAFRRSRRDDDWSGWYYTATRDVELAIDEARCYFGMPTQAEVSIMPIVPRSAAYYTKNLADLLLAVAKQSPDDFEQVEAALEAVRAAREQKVHPVYRIELSKTVFVNEMRGGRIEQRPHRVRMCRGAGEDGTGWQEWHRCTQTQ